MFQILTTVNPLLPHSVCVAWQPVIDIRYVNVKRTKTTN